MYYVLNGIFEDNKVNLLVDKLFYFLDQEFTFNNIKEKFILSGNCAEELQYTDPFEDPDVGIINFVFICSDTLIYQFLLNQITNLLTPTNCIKFKERILLEFDFIKMEIWYQDVILSTINYNSLEIYIQNIAQIPPILLKYGTPE